MINQVFTGSISYVPPTIEKRTSFADEYKLVIKQYKVTEENTCIAVFKTTRYPYSRELYKIYKTLDDFTKKFESDISELDAIYGVDIITWIFD